MNNIFFIRHENDLEFFLPLISNDSKPFIVFYDAISVESINIIKSNNYEYINIYRSVKFANLIFRFFNKFTYGLFQQKIISIYNNFLLSQIKKETKSNLHKIPLNKCSNVVFDHIVSDNVKFLVELISRYRKNNNLKFKIVSVPHGVGTIVNSMTDYFFIEPYISSGYQIYDLIVCNDKQHFDSFIDSGIDKQKLITIQSLRYTDTWVNNLLQKSSVIHNDEYKINILILHTKFIGNINSREVQRCVEILNNFDEFDVRVKSHPRGGYKEIKMLVKPYKKVRVVTENILGNIAWADYVLFFGSSAVYDAFILNKTVLFPSYATSNQLSKEILNSVICINSPDKFYENISIIASGKNITFEHDFENNYEEVLKSWQDILN